MVSHNQILLSLSIGYKLDSHSTYFHTAVYLIGTVLSVPMNRNATAIESSSVRNWISSSLYASVSWRSTATEPSIWKWSAILHGVLKLSEMNVGCLWQELFSLYIYIFYRYSPYPSSMPCAVFSVAAWGKENSISGWAISLPSITGIRSQTCTSHWKQNKLKKLQLGDKFFDKPSCSWLQWMRPQPKFTSIHTACYCLFVFVMISYVQKCK